MHDGSNAVVSGSLWRTWFVTVTVGEFVGFVVPAAVGALLADAPSVVMVPALVGAGVVEGAALGAAQARVLRREFGTFPTARFVVATSVAAALAYAIGLLPVVLGDRLTALPWPLLVAFAAALGAALLASIGTAQWWVLRSVLPGSASWIATTAGAWAAGLTAFLALTTPLWHPGQDVLVAAGIGILGGLVMAAVVAALTGLAFVRLVSRSNAEVSGRG